MSSHNLQYTVVMYESDWSECCRGHVTDSGPSYFETDTFHAREHAVRFISDNMFDKKCESKNKREWDEVLVFINGMVIGSVEHAKEADSIIQEASVSAGERYAEKLKADTRAAQQREAERTEMIRQRELAQYLRLREKYENC